jgi:hypothetical protein
MTFCSTRATASRISSGTFQIRRRRSFGWIDPEAVYGHFDLAAPGARETERDDPVKKYMPGAPAAWDKITIFNVLTHTSGIPDFTRSED